MFHANKKECQPIVGSAAEKIYELIGVDKGNSSNVSVAYLELPPKTSMPKHFHPDSEEIYYVLNGSSHLFVDGEIKEIKKDDVILIKRKSVHQLQNNSDHVLHLLTVTTPAWTPDSEILVN